MKEYFYSIEYNFSEKRGTMMNKKYQIFVSSTYKDLKQERQVAIDSIIKLRHIPAGMELFSATGENQFEMIKPIIYESDYYLLIVAGKYGTVCEDTGLSYTEMEYDFAIENQKRVIAFVHDDPENLPSSDRESTDKMRRKLKKFRQKVMSNKMVKMWHDKVDLYQSIPISISTVIEMYPATTCWMHVNENDTYTPLGDYKPLKKEFVVPIKENIELYYNNLEKTVLQIIESTESICLKVDIPEKRTESNSDAFSGCSIRMTSDIKDWARYVLNDYYLFFDCHLDADKDIDMWIEIKGAAVEMYKQRFRLIGQKQERIEIPLKEYLDDLDDWKKVKEICLVFRPTEKSVHGRVVIENIKLAK